MMVKHKNRLVYDATTGNVRDDRKFLTMLDDYWFPRRSDGGGTQVQTLASGGNLGEMSDVEYFEKKLYQSLNVPTSRLQGEGGFNLGCSSEPVCVLTDMPNVKQFYRFVLWSVENSYFDSVILNQ